MTPDDCTTGELPLIYPSVNGVPGVISRDPIRIQCQGCGRIEPLKTGNLLRFHAAPWTSGHTDNPRLCVACRIARGCICVWCADERRCYERGWRP